MFGVFKACLLFGIAVQAANPDSCPGYKATNIQNTWSKLTADLTLAGPPCNAYGTDLADLRLLVEYQTDKRLHVKIYDTEEQVYQVPSSVVPRPDSNTRSSEHHSDLEFIIKNTNPFSFAVQRKHKKDVIFESSDLIFESQYLRMRSSLPEDPFLYGFGEDTDPFRLNTTDYVRTLWSRDAYLIPPGTNLYGNHPVYFEHRLNHHDHGRPRSQTHGVFLLNSNGIDLKLDKSPKDGQFVEYNTLGGVFDFYFMAGPSPAEVSKQYSEIIEPPTMMPYWSLGFHQCRYGMNDVYEVTDVVFNYSAADIPLETMWTDIDYMDLRKVFTLDPVRFPLAKMRELVNHLHEHDQRYIVMQDPAVAYQDYSPFTNGAKDGAFVKHADGSVFKGVVWPGVTAFPDWFNTNTQTYWNNEFDSFFSADSGVDIDGLWIDMNEASNFAQYPDKDPQGFAESNGDPPLPPTVRASNPMDVPGWPADLQHKCQVPAEFRVNVTTQYGQNIFMIGNVTALGDWYIYNAARLSAADYTVAHPLWYLDIPLPPDTIVSYKYVFQQGDGSYVYENGNRTVSVGPCGSPKFTQYDAYAGDSDQTAPAVTKKVNEYAAHHNVHERSNSGGNGGASDKMGLSGRDLTHPPYEIHNAAGGLSDKTLWTGLIHEGGYTEYDTHNLYGTMMSYTSRNTMIHRRPGLRPIIITRSTFAGAGAQVGHWLGDNSATWFDYRVSIAESIAFAAIYQVPMVGADVCGFAGETTEKLCARWAMLGAFLPFYRNHESMGFTPHEFYRWPLTAAAARKAIKARYQLLDYIYTSMHQQSVDGEPTLYPMFFLYPEDKNTFDIALQYFYGKSLLISPVTNEDATEVTIYMPDDQFYDYFTHQPIRGTGAWSTLTNVDFTSIPVHIRGGSILPERVDGANTTTNLRKLDFNLVVAPGLDGTAVGDLYLDDGVSLDPTETSNIHFELHHNHKLSMTGTYGYDAGVKIADVILLGQNDPTRITVNKPLTHDFTIKLPHQKIEGVTAQPNGTAVPQWYGHGS